MKVADRTGPRVRVAQGVFKVEEWSSFIEGRAPGVEHRRRDKASVGGSVGGTDGGNDGVSDGEGFEHGLGCG